MTDKTPLPEPGHRTNHRFGWRPDPFDIRDEEWAYKAKLGGELRAATEPQELIVTNRLDKVERVDQLQTSSCVGCAVGGLHAAVREVVMRSALQVYYEARRIIGETHMDEGCYIRDGMKVISTLGAGRQRWWPMDPSKVTVDPIEKVDRDALKRRIFSYHRLEGRDDYLACLQAGFPFVIGFTCYSGLMAPLVARYGIVAWPRQGEYMIGGHAIIIYGYDPRFKGSAWAQRARDGGVPEWAIPDRVYLCRNSWGKGWGNGGDFAIDANYIDHPYLADDAWTCRKVKPPVALAA